MNRKVNSVILEEEVIVSEEEVATSKVLEEEEVETMGETMIKIMSNDFITASLDTMHQNVGVNKMKQKKEMLIVLLKINKICLCLALMKILVKTMYGILILDFLHL